MREEEFQHLYELEERFWWFVGMRDITAALLGPAGLDRAARALDVGCGTGYMLRWLERAAGGMPVVGLEFSAAGLAFCRERGHPRLVRASAAGLPFRSASFDLVTSFEVLDELRDDRPAFDELARVLRPGGRLLIRLPALEWLRSSHDVAIETQRRTTTGELAAKLEARGLAVERATYANTLLLPLIAAVRLGRRLLPGDGERGSDVRPLPAGLRWLEGFFLACLRAEARYLGRPGARLPIGVSALCLARKG